MDIMVVEDDEAIRDLIVSTLAGGGYTTCAAQDGLDALEVLKTRRPDAILLDVNMPRMDGFALLAKLKADPDTADLPVLMLTAQSASDDIRRAIQLGANDYVGKPFEARQLLRRLGRVLGS